MTYKTFDFRAKHGDKLVLEVRHDLWYVGVRSENEEKTHGINLPDYLMQEIAIRIIKEVD